MALGERQSEDYMSEEQRLRRELAAMTRCCKAADRTAANALRELAEARRGTIDAARYRWLRKNSTQPMEAWSTHSSPESLDAIVDESMRAESLSPPQEKK